MLPFSWVPTSSAGGDDGVRTHDPLLAGQVLSQLSYTPINEVLGIFPFLNDHFRLSPAGSLKIEQQSRRTHFCALSRRLFWFLPIYKH